MFKYLFLTQEQRRALPANAQMKAGVAVGNILQKFYSDTIWNFGPQRKLQPNKNILKGKDKAGEFYRKLFYTAFAYVSHRIPEITDDLYKIDRALCAGFGWEIGPFQMWDALDVGKTLSKMEESGYNAADWVHEMLKSGTNSFYSTEEGN